MWHLLGVKLQAEHFTYICSPDPHLNPLRWPSLIIIFSTLQMRTSRETETKEPATGHAAGEQQSWDLNREPHSWVAPSPGSQHCLLRLVGFLRPRNPAISNAFEFSIFPRVFCSNHIVHPHPSLLCHLHTQILCLRWFLSLDLCSLRVLTCLVVPEVILKWYFLFWKRNSKGPKCHLKKGYKGIFWAWLQVTDSRVYAICSSQHVGTFFSFFLLFLLVLRFILRMCLDNILFYLPQR